MSNKPDCEINKEMLSNYVKAKYDVVDENLTRSNK